MPTYSVNSSSITTNVASLVLDSVTGLTSGCPLEVEGVGSPFDGIVTLSAVDSSTASVSYSVLHADIAATDAFGAARIPIDWITIDDAIGFLGLQPSTPDDMQYLEDCVAAAQEWAYDRRLAFGYTDRPHIVPSGRVRQGTILYAGALYRERGSVDSYPSFQGMDTPAPVASLGQINRLLGVYKPRVA